MSIRTDRLSRELVGGFILTVSSIWIAFILAFKNAISGYLDTLATVYTTIVANGLGWPETWGRTAFNTLEAFVRPLGPFAPLVFAAVFLLALWLLVQAIDRANGGFPP